MNFSFSKLKGSYGYISIEKYIKWPTRIPHTSSIMDSPIKISTNK